jgi:hypothetical protein
MKPRTLHGYRLISNFHTDRHFIYITTLRDESKEELQSYYKLTDEDMEKITKECSEEFLILVDDAEISDTKIIGSPLVTQFEHARQSSVKKKKKKEEVQNIETDKEDNAYEGNGSGSLGEGDEANGKGGGDEGEKQGEGEATPLEDPPLKQ